MSNPPGGAIARAATNHPFSPKFRTALRGQRDRIASDPPALSGVFSYFASHGDETDLKWIEKISGNTDETRTQAANEAIEKLRKRLAVEGQ